MALTKGDWTQKTVKGTWRATCNVAFTTAENDAYTLKTPAELDPTRPWTLTVAAAATADAEALPMDLWIGHSDLFELSGDGANVTTTDGAMWKQITDDVVLAVTTVEHVFLMDPNQATADVVTVGAIATGYKLKVPVVPYYAINLDAGSTLNATNCDFTISQAAVGSQNSVNR